MKINEKKLKALKSNKTMGLVQLNNVLMDDLNIEKYSHIEGSVDGHTYKDFFRVDSNIFQEAFEEIQNNPNCKFQTPYNEIVKEGIIPEMVSVLIKGTERSKEEMLASQILNYFQVGTPVNLSAVGERMFEGYRLPYSACGNSSGIYDYVISMDFIGENQRLEDLTIAYDNRVFWFFDESEDAAAKAFEKMLTTGGLKNLPSERKNEIYTNLMEDFVRSYLVRKFVLMDSDFNDYNVGVLIDDKKGDAQIINFDFEYTFHHFCNIGELVKNATPIVSRYPFLWCEFVEKCENFLCEIKDADRHTKSRVLGPASIQDGLVKSLNNILMFHDKIANNRLSVELNLNL